MVNIIKSFIDLIIMYINSVFNFQIELIDGHPVSIGIVVIAFVFIVVSIFMILKAIGLIKEGD